MKFNNYNNEQSTTYRYSSSLLRILLFDLPDGGREFFPVELAVPFPLEADEDR